MADKENVLVKMDDFIQYFLPKIERMPRNYKFIIGDRIVKLQLDLLELLIEAYYSKQAEHKTGRLHQANVQVEKLRHLMQLCMNMKFINLKQFEQTSQMLNEIGMALGGWIKYLQGSKK